MNREQRVKLLSLWENDVEDTLIYSYPTEIFKQLLLDMEGDNETNVLKELEDIERDVIHGIARMRELLNEPRVKQEQRVKVSDLCEKSLQEKWNQITLSKLNEKCPFCYEVEGRYYKLVCGECLCPKEICDAHGDKGYIGKMGKLRVDNPNYDPDPDSDEEDNREYIYRGDFDHDVKHMQSLFKKYIL